MHDAWRAAAPADCQGEARLEKGGHAVDVPDLDPHPGENQKGDG